MKIALDTTPISEFTASGHKFRGVGSYVRLLSENLKKVDSKNSYIFFSQGESLPADIDVLHFPYLDLFSMQIPFMKQYKTVITIHDLIPIKFPQHFPAGLKGRIKWNLQKIALGKIDGIITDSQASKKDIIQLAGIREEKVHVVYLAAENSFKKLSDGDWKEKLRKKYLLPEKYLLYVGDATWNKNLPLLISAVLKLNIPLVMAGKVFTDEKFDKQNIWNRDLATVFENTRDDKLFLKLGFVSKEDLVGLYNLATVFVMPSLYEGFGLPILESMQSGCSVVTASSGSIPEVGGKAVFYVDPYSLDEIVESVKKVFFDAELRSRLSKDGLLQAKKFTIESTILNTVRVYQSVFQGRLSK